MSTLSSSSPFSLFTLLYLSFVDWTLYYDSERLQWVAKNTEKFLVYRKRHDERELLKDRSQMAVFSLITAFDTLLVSSMEQRGPTVTSCGGFLIYHPHTRSAHEFSTASPWISSRSHHPHPVPGMLCTLWTASIQPQPVLTSEPCSFCRRCGLA